MPNRHLSSPAIHSARLLLRLAVALALSLCASTAMAQIVINEIMQNPSAVSDANGEWFELFNSTGADVDIDGWTIEDNDVDAHVIDNGGPLVVPAGGYIVLGVNADSSTNGGVTVAYQYPSDFFLSNSSDELVLRDGGSIEIDRVEWDDGATFPDPNGASMSLIDPALDNNVGGNWCAASTPFGAGDLGTPGAANDCAPPVPELVINEILQNPSAVFDSDGEWFEVYNPTGAPIDIEGWTIQDNDFDTHLIANGGPLEVPAGGFLVLGNNADFGTNGGVNVAYQYSGFFLGNGADELVLLDTGLTEVDRVEWDDGATFPDPTGAAMALISPALDNNVGANWCTAETPFGAGDLGTPGAANDCPVALTELVINEIMQNPSAVSDSNGEWFELFNPTDSAIDIDGWAILDNDFDFHLIDNGGPLPVPAGGFLVLGRNADSGANGGVDIAYQYSGVFLANGSDELVLLDGVGAEVDRVEWDNGATFPDPNGASMALIDPALDNNSGANWCTAGSPFGAGDSGTPGQVNDCGFQPVVNEIDYDQPGADFAEFIEIKNRGSESGDLSTVTLELINGSGGGAVSYGSFVLPAVTLNPGEYFVVCEDATTVAVCDYDILSSIQNGAPDAVALVIGGEVVDTVSYEGDTAAPYTEGSGSGLFDSGSAGNDYKGISRLPDGWDTNMNNADLLPSCVTPGAANTVIDVGCTFDGPVLEIFDIQGAGEATPFAGQSLGTSDNIVTTLATNGFFIQTPDARTDGDVNTSDGIFVYTGGAPGVAVGDQVDVRGTVIEFFGFTEFDFGASVSIDSSGNPLPAATVFDANVPSPDPTAPSCAIEFECYEGMLIEIADGSVSGPNQRFGSDPIAEVHIVAGTPRAYREPGIEFPGLPGLPEWDGNPEVFELDPDKLGLPNQIIPAGSGFSGTGVLGFEFGGYEFWPSSLTVYPAPMPDPVQARLPGEFTVGTLNLFRLFDDVDDPSDFAADGRERDDFVASTEDYTRRLAKFAAHIVDVLDAPDILAVQEAESLAVLIDLASAISLYDGSVAYTAHLVEGNDVGTIDVGFLTRERIQVDTITQLGKDEFYENPVNQEPEILHDRPPLLLEGYCLLDYGAFPIAVMTVHNRSLSGIDDPVEGARVRQKRYEQAVSIGAKVQAIQDDDPGVRLVVLGDFNAFEFTDGYVDAVGIIRGDFDPAMSLVCDTNTCDDVVEPNLANEVLGLDPLDRYSFIFRGTAQVLDHALTTAGLADEMTGADFGRGNADAAVDLINDDVTPAVLPLRSSDHDGLVVYILKDEDNDGVPNDDDMCPGTVIPEAVPTNPLGVNRFALTDGDGIFDTTPPAGEGPGKAFTIGDTAGCSCEQIAAAQGLGKGHVKFGCSIGEMEEWVELVSQP